MDASEVESGELRWPPDEPGSHDAQGERPRAPAAAGEDECGKCLSSGNINRTFFFFNVTANVSYFCTYVHLSSYRQTCKLRKKVRNGINGTDEHYENYKQNL